MQVGFIEYRECKDERTTLFSLETSIAQDTLTQSTEPVKDQTGASAPTDSGDAGPKEEAEERPATEGSENNAATPPASYSDKKQQQQQRSSDEQRQQKSWQKNITLLWREIANHKNGAMFMNPIKEATAPSYYDIVKHPMDLKTIKSRIRDGVRESTLCEKKETANDDDDSGYQNDCGV